jgi:hypothetical protein
LLKKFSDGDYLGPRIEEDDDDDNGGDDDDHGPA